MEYDGELWPCTSCGRLKKDVADRESFGVYAGRLCERCCRKFRDNCGLDQPQGDQNELDERVEPD